MQEMSASGKVTRDFGCIKACMLKENGWVSLYFSYNYYY